MSAEPRFLVTGAHGCIGAWIVFELLEAGRRVITLDRSTEPLRLRLLLGDRVSEVDHVAGDITDLASLQRTIDEHGITNVIHLAALQVPFVRSDPPLGARVNVIGTVNVFEAAARRELAPLVYASSVAALDAGGTTAGTPSTLYGVFKRTNEETAAVYYAEQGVASIGLRPHTVYGVGRDQGVTSAPTTAMLAAAADTAYTIPYGGEATLQFTRDVARAFVAASLSRADGASVHNLPGSPVALADVLAAIRNVVPTARVDLAAATLPFPAEMDSASFATLVPDFAETSLVEGVRATIDRFHELLALGLLSPPSTR